MAVQDWIHRVEEGSGLRYVKWALVVLALVVLTLSYNYRGFKNMANPEAMDAAQVARNLAEGKGYTTLFIRPLSLRLVQQAYDAEHGPAALGDLTDRCSIKGMHPDLANPPAYPTLLAGLMKAMPGYQYQAAGSNPIWNRAGKFWMYAPDFYISLFNQFLFLISAVVLFFLARRLFDREVAWTTAALFLGTDLFWRFSISGLSTMLLILIFLGLAWCLVLLEQNAREENGSAKRGLALAAAAGALLALGMLTRYSFGWLMLPAAAFLVLFAGRQRVTTPLVALGVFAALVTPWLARNYHASQTLFGTAGFAMFQNTGPFSEFRLERSLNPDFEQLRYFDLWFKLMGNLRGILQDELPKLGGNWVTAFFLVGLMMSFRNPAIRRLRWFALFCLPVLIVAQALGRTSLTDKNPVINSENLLILLMPLFILFGVALFFVLLEQVPFTPRLLRYAAIGGFCAVTCLPMILTFTSGRTVAVAYPPYHPPTIQAVSNWMKPDELMMSDIPWAVAWYGKRQCIWLTLNVQDLAKQDDFFSVSDYRKEIKGLYLTPETMDSKFVSQWIRAKEKSWGSFIIEVVLKQQLPPYFPLRKFAPYFLPEQMFLSDRERWIQ